jgi:hypothetical protein
MRLARTATRGGTSYTVPATKVSSAAQTFSQIAEVPAAVRHVQLHAQALPEQYRVALHNVG